MNALPKSSDHFHFDSSYAQLHEKFYERIHPTPVAIRVNEPLARDLQLDPVRLAEPEGVAMLAGNSVPCGSSPVAMA